MRAGANCQETRSTPNLTTLRHDERHRSARRPCGLLSPALPLPSCPLPSFPLPFASTRLDATDVSTMKVLVAGGAGFIGSHFVRLLHDQGIDVSVVDDLSAGHQDSLPASVPFVRADVGDSETMRSVLADFEPFAVVDFAGLIQVGESMARPDRYFKVNVAHSLILLDELIRAGVRAFVYSSTAAVYGNPIRVPIDEDHPKAPINPYGASKLAIEYAALAYAQAFDLRVACLRYFNAAGAHPSGELDERHSPETHLIPLAIDAALGKGPALQVFGEDWDTPDGTCLRDYIHVMDLAEAHLQALHAMHGGEPTLVLNLGTGQGVSVREVLSAVERVTGCAVPWTLAPRRAGDPPQLVASAERAASMIGWRARHTSIEAIVGDAVRARKRRYGLG